MYSDSRYVLHSYNTTQNLMVQGKNSHSFVAHCLEPYFSDKITSVLDKIKLFNNAVEERLSASSLPAHPTNTFKCAHCDVLTRSLPDLKVHLKICHTKPSLESPRMPKSFKPSNESLSAIEHSAESSKIVDITDTLDIEMLTCHQCDFVTETETELQHHISQLHATVKESTNFDEAQVHVPEREEIAIKCERCNFETTSQIDMGNHVQINHTTVKVCISSEDAQVLSCDLCDYKSVLNI